MNANNIMQLRSDAEIEAAVLEVAKQTVKAKKVDLSAVFPTGKLETMLDFTAMRNAIHQLDTSHPNYGEILTMLRNFPRPSGIARELFDMNPDNFVFNDDTGIGVLLGRDPWEKEYK
ncbi:hypothetical protein [Enterobacter mori]